MPNKLKLEPNDKFYEAAIELIYRKIKKLPKYKQMSLMRLVLKPDLVTKLFNEHLDKCKSEKDKYELASIIEMINKIEKINSFFDEANNE